VYELVRHSLRHTTGFIGIIHWIIVAISKHVIAQDALPGGDKGIGVDESAPGRIVITALEIVQP
jgi:hypothetical protein